MQERAQRRLAAIIAADVAGFSRLVGVDEEGTLAALRRHRAELIEPLLREHGGRIANTTGDSYLLEFPSAVDALRCVIAMQQGMRERDAGLAPDRRIAFRVGLNVGDVIAEGDDLLGDGVNIAARLEALAEPGDIVISRAARDQVRDRLDVNLEDLGEVQVKNIARPLRAFRVVPEGQGKRSRGATAPRHPSIAVLPFANLGGGADRELFSDGLTNDIITDLSRFRDLMVIAANSTFVYKDKPTRVQQVAADLGVRFVLEGSVQWAGDRMRINVQFIDALTGEHIWADRYDRKLDNIFAVQDEISGRVVAILGAYEGRIAEASIGRARQQHPANLSAYELASLARDTRQRFNKDDNRKTIALAQ